MVSPPGRAACALLISSAMAAAPASRQPRLPPAATPPRRSLGQRRTPAVPACLIGGSACHSPACPRPRHWRAPADPGVAEGSGGEELLEAPRRDQRCEVKRKSAKVVRSRERLLQAEVLLTTSNPNICVISWDKPLQTAPGWAAVSFSIQVCRCLVCSWNQDPAEGQFNVSAFLHTSNFVTMKQSNQYGQAVIHRGQHKSYTPIRLDVNALFFNMYDTSHEIREIKKQGKNPRNLEE